MAEADVNSEAQSESMPVLKSERPYGFKDYTVVITGFACAAWCFITGGSLALYVDVPTALVGSIAGNIVAVLLMSLATQVISGKYGVDAYTSVRGILGGKGTKVFLILMSIFVIAWLVILCMMVAKAVGNIVLGFTGTDITTGVPMFILSVIAGAICWMVAWKGPVLLKKLNNFVAPIFVIILIFLFVVVSMNYGWDTVLSAKPLAPFEDQWLNFLVVFELSMGAGFSWWPNMGGVAKLCKTTKAAFWPNVIGLVFAATLGTVMGVAASLLVNSSDPTAWMIPMGGLGLGTAALLLVICADITACSVMLYNLGIGIKQVKTFVKIPWGKCTGLITLIAFVGMIWAEPLYDNFYIILGISSMSCAPIAMMQLVDYYAFRKKHISIRDAYNNGKNSKYYFWGGFNWVAIGVFAASVVLYLAVFDPFLCIPHDAFRYCNATTAVCVFSALAYYVLGKLLLVKRGIGGFPKPNEKVGIESNGKE